MVTIDIYKAREIETNKLVEGLLVEIDNRFFILPNNSKDITIEEHVVNSKYGYNIGIYGFVEVKKETIRKYIGYTDSYNVKIFQGDIVQFCPYNKPCYVITVTDKGFFERHLRSFDPTRELNVQVLYRQGGDDEQQYIGA